MACCKSMGPSLDINEFHRDRRMDRKLRKIRAQRSIFPRNKINGWKSKIKKSFRKWGREGGIDPTYRFCMALKIKTEIFWFVTPCSFVDRYQYFGGACCPHLRPTSNPLYLTLLASILKMEAAHSSETLVSTYKETRSHNPGDYNVGREALQSVLQWKVVSLYLGILGTIRGSLLKHCH